MSDELPAQRVDPAVARTVASPLCAQDSDSLLDVIGVMLRVFETRDPLLAGHMRRVGLLAADLARELALPRDQVDAVHIAGSLHDLGKWAVPRDVLEKPGRLTPCETRAMQLHPEAGHRLLVDLALPPGVPEMVLQHHERFDGSGYPSGLVGSRTCFGARIIAVADTIEALTADRPHRPRFGLSFALEELQYLRGELYDPVVVDACIGMMEGLPAARAV